MIHATFPYRPQTTNRGGALYVQTPTPAFESFRSRLSDSFPLDASTRAPHEATSSVGPLGQPISGVVRLANMSDVEME